MNFPMIWLEQSCQFGFALLVVLLALSKY